MRNWKTTFISCALFLTAAAWAMPPHPDVVEAIKGGQIEEPYALRNRVELLARGVDSSRPAGRSIGLPKAAAPAATKNILCILVQFSDKPSSVSTTDFDTLMFVNQSGSVRHFYNEVSYNAYDIVTVNLPSSLGWHSAPQTYAYYCNGQNGLGLYPQNTQKLAEDLIDLVDPSVNFANYDNDGDNWVDGIVIVHAGTGGEWSGSSNDIWSHRWGIVPRVRDGKNISDYCVNPEFWATPGDMTIGVYCHEMGHLLFGLPDLYDTDGDSRGLGRWSLMAVGSWNGVNGNSPAHFDAWCRLQCGFASATNITGNVSGQSIPNVESTSSGAIFRLWTNGVIGAEYFLVENRQSVGYDAGLPSYGLLIYHIDEAVATDNDKQWYPGYTAFGHYLVAVEQADNLYYLEKNIGYGDAGDPFPGTSLKTSFSGLTTPSSNDYNDLNTLVQVGNISNSAPTMTADLMVSLAADVDDFEYQATLPDEFDLKQNYPNPFNPSTRIGFDVKEGGPVELSVFNILGQKVETLVNEQLLPGSYSVDWSAISQGGTPLPSGAYFYRLRTDEVSVTRKMVLLH